MQAYSKTLHSLQLFLVVGQIIISLLRFSFQLLISLPTVIAITEAITCSIICWRERNHLQAKFYVLGQFVLIIFMIINYLKHHFGVYRQFLFFQEYFKVQYETWGYTCESFFRLFACLVAWRSIQLSQIKKRISS